MENGQELHTLWGHAGWFEVVALSEDGRRIVSASKDMRVKVWDAESGETMNYIHYWGRQAPMSF